MKIKEGDKLPLAEFFYLDNNGPQKIKSIELFNNQKTIVIGVPGAFTKICSAKQEKSGSWPVRSASRGISALPLRFNLRSDVSFLLCN